MVPSRQIITYHSKVIPEVQLQAVKQLVLRLLAATSGNPEPHMQVQASLLAPAAARENISKHK